MATGERQKSNRFRLAKQQLCMCITFLFTIFLPLLHDYNVKLLKPGFHMITTIAVIAAIAEKKKISAIAVIIAIIRKPLSSDRSDCSDHSDNDR